LLSVKLLGEIQIEVEPISMVCQSLLGEIGESLLKSEVHSRHVIAKSVPGRRATLTR
jgi:hypothetical protein